MRWQLLIQGTDYYLDPSGLWFALATKLDQNDYLAVSYTTAGGTTVGSFPAQDQGQGSSDSLRLIVEPKRGPEAVTFRQEMRQIYRVAGADLDPASLAGQPVGQPLGAAPGRRDDLPGAARPGGAHRPECLRPGEPAVSPHP